MNRRPLRSGSTVKGFRAAGAIAAVWCATSCHQELDTTRQAPPKATLGDDLYGVLCDRVGADSLTEDITGASYQGVCHFNERGEYADTVDVSQLPPVMGDAEKARALGVAKVELMGRRRSELIRALNAAFPDISIDNVATPAEGDSIRLHDGLMSFAQSVAPLYETNPYDRAGAPLMPSSTRALGRLFEALAESEPAREALARMGGRRGYRPNNVALGAIRPALAYPGLRALTKAALAVIGPDGSGAPLLQQLLTVVQHELRTSKPVVAGLGPFSVDPDTLQPSRPRSSIEFAASFLLDQHDSFAADPTEAPRYIALRDRRGFVLPVVDPNGGLTAPFTDADGDGLADVDALGRFINAQGLPVAAPPPFAIPGVQGGAVDAFGRPETPLYQYVDTSRTVVASLARSLLPLADPTHYASPGDPDAWQSEHESLMYALAGAYRLYGDREDAQYDYENETILPADEGCATCVPYRRFRGEDSPLPDLAHAAGQILADKDSDALLAGIVDLLEHHEPVVARLVGAALHVREIALKHDELARQGKEPFASMPYETPIWDEIAAILGRITKHPGLTKKLIAAFGDPTLASPSADGSSKHMGDTLGKLAVNRDELTYDPFNINGPAVNLTVGAPDTSDPKTPVDQTKPKNGKNRSCLQRSFQVIHDANGVKACNKEGAKVKAVLGSTELSWPLFGSYKECELFAFDNLAPFYLGSILDADHPKRSELKIKGALDGILKFLGVFTSPDELFEESTGITGMTLHPSSPALNRLVFFGASSEKYPGMPDHDAFNEDSRTNSFISSALEPVSPSVCPIVQPNGTRECEDMKDLLRVRGANTIFLWERFGFYDYLRPILTEFANVSCSEDLSSCDTADMTGETIFVDLIEVLHRHWPGKDHGDECTGEGDAASNPKYCSEAGVNTYEPILGEAFAGDLIPAVVDFARVASEISAITVKRGADKGQVWSGGEVLERMTRILFDTDYAASVGMVDRKGKKETTWVNGQPQPQLTGFSLFADAFHKMDVRFDSACSCEGKEGQALAECESGHDACQEDAERRKGQWKRARSQLVDQFLAVEGEGEAARFKNAGAARTVLAFMRSLREQLNANCPEREAPTLVPCTWAKKDLGDKLAETLSGPLFAALMDVQEALRADEPSRRELEKFLTYALSSQSGNDALQGMLASASDILQTLANDGDLAPILNAVAGAAAPADDPAGPGVADTMLKVLKAVTGDEYDRYHVLDHILPNLVTPMDGGQGMTPIEVIMDVIADVNRIDSSSQDPLVTEDYKFVMGSVRDFLTSKTRGLEQFYFIVQNRPRQ